MVKPSQKFRSEFYRNLAFIVGIVPGTVFMNSLILNDPVFDSGFTFRVTIAIVFIWLFREIMKHSLKILEEAENV